MPDEPGSWQRMGDADALMWSIEKDPMLRSTITAVLVFDRPLDRARLTDKLERGSRAIPRLRQRVVANTFSLAPPRWELDPNFDLRYHLRFVASPGLGTMADVLAIAGPEAMSSFDLARPLWQMLVVDGMADGRSALIAKLHHTITDGIGAVNLALQLFDLEESPAAPPGPLPPVAPVHVMNQWERFWDAWGYEQRQGLELASWLVPATAGTLAHLVVSPGPTLRRGRETAASLGRLLAPASRPLSPIMTGRSLSIDLDTFSLPLADAKAAAAAAGCRLNDFFLAGVIGGLRRYHDEHGARPDALRMGMPISVRPVPEAGGRAGSAPPPVPEAGSTSGGSAGSAPPVPEAGGSAGVGGNQFVPTRFLVPLDIDDPAERMRAVRALVAGQRAEPALGMADALSLVTRRLPRAAQIGVLGGLLRTVDVITSNVPGVPVPLFVAGARMEAHYAFGPRSGAAVNVTLLSYLDGLFIGVNSDPSAVEDQGVFMACLRDGFDEVLKLV